MTGHLGVKRKVIVWLLMTAVCNIELVRSSEEVEKILNATFHSYDKNVRPGFSQGPVQVGVTAHILSVSKVDTSNQEFTVDLFLRQTWNDPRLRFEPRPGVSNVTLETDYLRRVWVPDTFFLNEVTTSFQSTTVSNELIRLKANGEVTRSMRVTVTASCPMKLRDFPFDHPLCSLLIESFSSSKQEVIYEWIGRPSSITVAPHAAHGDFLLVGYRLDAVEEYSMPPTGGVHSQLTVDIQLRRIFGRYHTEYFSPCILLATVAVLGLWSRHPKFSIALTVAVLIALQTLKGLQSALIKLPRWVEYSWLDAYVHLCSTFTLLAMIVSLLELNVPDYEEPEEDNEEVSVKVDGKKEARSSSVASEDVKLVRPRLRSECETTDQSDEQTLEEAKKRLFTAIRLTHRYYCIGEPYIKWVLIMCLLLSNLVFWKMTPVMKPLHNLVHV